MNQRRAGLTLMELVIVILLLAILAGIVVPLVGTSVEDGRTTVTHATMKALRDAILLYHQDMKGLDVMNAEQTGIPATLSDLQVRPRDSNNVEVPLFDPAVRRGWRGPYLMQATGRFDLTTLDTSFATYGTTGDTAFVDGWGNPIVLQRPTTSGKTIDERARYVRLISAGPPTLSTGGKLQSTLDVLASQLMPLTSERGNDLVLFVLEQDKYP